MEVDITMNCTQDQKREKIRSELIKELLGSPEKKKCNKLQCGIKKANGKAKFLANPNKHKQKGERREW